MSVDGSVKDAPQGACPFGGAHALFPVRVIVENGTRTHTVPGMLGDVIMSTARDLGIRAPVTRTELAARLAPPELPFISDLLLIVRFVVCYSAVWIPYLAWAMATDNVSRTSTFGTYILFIGPALAALWWGHIVRQRVRRQTQRWSLGMQYWRKGRYCAQDDVVICGGGVGSPEEFIRWAFCSPATPDSGGQER